MAPKASSTLATIEAISVAANGNYNRRKRRQVATNCRRFGRCRFSRQITVTT